MHRWCPRGQCRCPWALQGEQSLIQINANNSTVTVLVNLTVIMNSTVGTVNQGNNGK